MLRRRSRLAWSGLVAALLCPGPASAQNPPVRPGPTKEDRARAAEHIPLEQLPPRTREGARLALEKPTVFTPGLPETFQCDPAVYYYLLDHPDRAVTAWRKIGARCVSISDRGQGKFGWSDDQGGDIVWETVYRTPTLRVWYAEGKVKPSPLLPRVPVKAVVALHHSEARGRDGEPLVSHRADFFLHTDSVAAALATKLFGASAPRMAEDCIKQLQMFFAGLAWYIHRHPDRAAELLSAPPTGN